MLTGSATMACENVTAVDYYWLCDTAREVGVRMSLDDPDSSVTVAGLVDITRQLLRHKRLTDTLLEMDRRFPR